MIYAREQFKKAISSLEQENKFRKEINNLVNPNNKCGYYVEFYPPSCDFELCAALEAMFDDNTEAVSWFCYEIDFGRDYTEGSNELNGKEYPLRNADELYDYLCIVHKLKLEEEKNGER